MIPICLPKYKCHVVNQSEMLLERQQTSGLNIGQFDLNKFSGYWLKSIEASRKIKGIQQFINSNVNYFWHQVTHGLVYLGYIYVEFKVAHQCCSCCILKIRANDTGCLPKRPCLGILCFLGEIQHPYVYVEHSLGFKSRNKSKQVKRMLNLCRHWI